VSHVSLGSIVFSGTHGDCVREEETRLPAAYTVPVGPKQGRRLVGMTPSPRWCNPEVLRPCLLKIRFNFILPSRSPKLPRSKGFPQKSDMHFLFPLRATCPLYRKLYFSTLTTPDDVSRVTTALQVRLTVRCAQKDAQQSRHGATACHTSP
jgi:hypothetical protein